MGTFSAKGNAPNRIIPRAKFNKAVVLPGQQAISIRCCSDNNARKKRREFRPYDWYSPCWVHKFRSGGVCSACTSSNRAPFVERYPERLAAVLEEIERAGAATLKLSPYKEQQS